MLAITCSAAEAIRSVLAAVTPPSEAVMRISLESHDGIRWALSVSDRPTPADQVVSERDVDVLMDPDAASALDDKVLDACVEGGRIQFLVEQQGETDTPRARPRDRARLGGQPDEDRGQAKTNRGQTP